MNTSGFRTGIACGLVAACSLLALTACGTSPWAPGLRLQVNVWNDSGLPAAGKKIEVLGTSLSQFTDANGLAVFVVTAGSHVVRAYDIGRPGPGLAFVEESVLVEPGRPCKVQFFDCTMCR